jgi:hypothetical protein
VPSSAPCSFPALFFVTALIATDGRPLQVATHPIVPTSKALRQEWSPTAPADWAMESSRPRSKGGPRTAAAAERQSTYSISPACVERAVKNVALSPLSPQCRRLPASPVMVPAPRDEVRRRALADWRCPWSATARARSEMSSQIPCDRQLKYAGLARRCPLAELPHAGLEHLVGVKAGILTQQRLRERRD